MRLNDMKVGKRLGWGFGCLTLLMVLLAGVGWWQITVVNDDMNVALTESDKMLQVKEVGTALDNVYLSLWGLVTAKDAATKQVHKTAIDGYRSSYKATLDKLKAESRSAESRASIARLEEALEGARALNLRILDMAFKSEGQNPAALELFIQEGGKLMADKIDPAIQTIVSYRENRIREVEATAQSAVLVGKWSMGIGALVAAGLASVLGLLITRSIVAPLHECTRISGLLSQGDFSKEVPLEFRQRGDELGDLALAFHDMTTSIRNLLLELSTSVQTVASAATELSATTEQMAATTTQIAQTTDAQRDGSEQMAAAITELAASIDEVSKSAQSTMKLMESTVEATQRGDKAGAETQEAMKGITTTTGQIAMVISVITDIARQTNLLSLNAAIEAAKAGQQGKGFAVVAEEVRKLAERSGTSARTIADHIESSRSAVAQGTATVTTSVQLLRQIRESLDLFAVQTRQVSVATLEQSRAGSEVARRVEQNVQQATATASATAQMSATTSEIARTVSDLAQVAERLQGLAQKFKL